MRTVKYIDVVGNGKQTRFQPGLPTQVVRVFTTQTTPHNPHDIFQTEWLRVSSTDGSPIRLGGGTPECHAYIYCEGKIRIVDSWNEV